MRFSAIISALALGAAAAAVPTEVSAREIAARDECSNSGGSLLCCNGLLNCLLSVLGETCGQETYCCGIGNNAVRPSNPRGRFTTSSLTLILTQGNGAIVFNNCNRLL